MFIAQMLLCSSIAARCVGVEDETGLVSNVAACEKRIEEMVSDAQEIMPLFVVVHVGCKEGWYCISFVQLFMELSFDVT